jgi:hypothetical protein
MLVIFRFVTPQIAIDYGRNKLEFADYLRALWPIQIIGSIGFLTYLSAFGTAGIFQWISRRLPSRVPSRLPGRAIKSHATHHAVLGE